ncbi:hypothetical protein [Methylobacterium dankookense]|uniref:hypothetical protein n=1 Tax=Methylobacterium dankookense TaxID=560405 RepID=UPI0011A436F1|nr:hypothetical protein [Methylobacterium dankookense]
MPTKQLTYAELAAVWGVSSEAARKKVEGLRLPRQPGNDGKVRVLIDLDDVQHRPQKPKSDRKPPGDHPEVEPLRQHVATLQAEVERLVILANSNRADFERERERAEKAAADLMALADRLAEAEQARSARLVDAEKARGEADQARSETAKVQAEADSLRAELLSWKGRPWWRRALG